MNMHYEIDEKHLRKFTKEEINDLPLRGWDGPVHLVRTPGELKKALKDMAEESALGFDTETRPTFKKGVCHPPSLLQLAGERDVWIFQLGGISLEDGLTKVLADKTLVKAGVAVKFDVQELKKLAKFKDGGFVDLGDVAKSHGMQTNGLRNLAANLLGIRISKGAQCSNWAKHELTDKQIAYAATDAWISREIYLWFRNQGLLPG